MDAAEYKVPCHQGRSQVRGTVAFGIAMRGYKELGAPRRCWRSCGCSHLRSPLALPSKLVPLLLLPLLLLLSSSRVPALQVQFVRRTSPLRQPAIWSPSERVCEFACLCLCL